MYVIERAACVANEKLLLIFEQNMLWPHIGAAGTPYARSCQPRTVLPGALPDPEVLFDSLLARKTFTPHPTKISSTLFYLASIIIHGELCLHFQSPR